MATALYTIATVLLGRTSRINGEHNQIRANEMENTMIETNLNHFTGSELYHRYLNLKLTDGVKYLAEHGGSHGAFWLIDALCSHQPKALLHPMLREYQFWTLKVNPDRSAILTCIPDKDRPPVITQKIPYTDFDLPEVSIWIVDGIALLPSEY